MGAPLNRRTCWLAGAGILLRFPVSRGASFRRDRAVLEGEPVDEGPGRGGGRP